MTNEGCNYINWQYYILASAMVRKLYNAIGAFKRRNITMIWGQRGFSSQTVI